MLKYTTEYRRWRFKLQEAIIKGIIYGISVFIGIIAGIGVTIGVDFL